MLKPSVFENLHTNLTLVCKFLPLLGKYGN